jgi:chlorite dismutase
MGSPAFRNKESLSREYHMDELTPRVLNHISLFGFTDSYWQLNEHARAAFHQHWLKALSAAATNVDVYQNTDSRADVLVWSALNAPEPATAAQFFGRLAVMTAPFRRLIRPVHSLWGFTQPSPDAKASSPQEIDPLSSTRLQYLVVFPFGSGAEWYGLSPTSRKETLDKYLRLGDEYQDVKQLMLEASYLQEQEFLLLYEADDLSRFSGLANELRNNDAARFSHGGQSAYTAIYRPAAETLALWK